MKVVVSTDSGNVAEHFGRCPEFTIAEIENGQVTKKEVIANPGHSTGFLPKFFAEKNASVLVCGGAGFRAQGICRELGIKMILGVTGSVDTALKKVAEGKLESGESMCAPGKGKGYGIPKEDGHGE